MILTLDPYFSKAASVSNVPHLFQKDFEPLDEKNAPLIQGIVVRLGHRLDADSLSHYPALKWVATVTTGTDHIDETYLKARGVTLYSLKGETDFLETIHATPEHTWGLLLALLRNIPAAHQSVCSGNWTRAPFEGQELYGKRLGIIGHGRVGRIIEQYAKAFGMEVLVTDKDGKNFEELLKTSDVVTLHVDLNPSSKHLIGEKELRSMKPSAILLNTSRGAIVVESALLNALKKDWIAGAALDVLEGETLYPIDASHPLIQYASRHRNLLLTPHIAGSTFDSLTRTAEFILMKVLKNHPQ